MKIRIADVVEESFVDGEGVRFAIFVQGCPHHCQGCHNPTTHDFNGGHIVETDKLIDEIKNAALISGITLTGGEPLCQIKACTEIAAATKALNMNVWCYTGYVYENLIDDKTAHTDFFTPDEVNDLLKYVDVLVDGPYIDSERDLTMTFCGSTNQRLIDIKKSLNMKKIISWNLT